MFQTLQTFQTAFKLARKTVQNEMKQVSRTVCCLRMVWNFYSGCFGVLDLKLEYRELKLQFDDSYSWGCNMMI